MSMSKVLLGLALLFGAGPALAQETAGDFQEGVHFFKIDTPTNYTPVDGIKVTEVFSYLCNHCATFEPYIQAWKARKPEGVEFTRIPVEFGRAIWSLYARAYVTASVLGAGEDAHMGMMDTLWKDRQQMRSMEEIAEFYEGYGLDAEQFISTSESFAVDMRMKNEQKTVREAGISGTPSMIVNGKYRVGAGGAVNSFDMLLAVVDALVAKEQVAMAASNAGMPEQVAGQ
jgi:thiol:disulfide interchange protein DsbA